MVSNFKVQYLETEDVIKDICRVNAVAKVPWNHRISVAMVGLISGVLIIFKVKALAGLAPAAAAMKVGYFLLLWAAAFAIGEVLAKTVGIKSAISSAEAEGFNVYKQRIEKWKKPLEVKVEFFDDYFTTWAKGLNVKKIFYSQIVQLFESNETIAILGRLEGSSKTTIFAFPKEGVENASVEELIAFIEQKAPAVKKGFKKINYTYKKKVK